MDPLCVRHLRRSRLRHLRTVVASHRIFFFFNDTAPPEIYTLSLHDALPISSSSCSTGSPGAISRWTRRSSFPRALASRSEEHTSELQSRGHLVCRLLLE